MRFIPRRWLQPILLFSLFNSSVVLGSELAPEITLEPRSARLGAVGHRETRTVDFTLTNHGSTPLTIEEAKPSCSCMTLDFSPKPIPAGEGRRGTVTIAFGRGYGKFHKQVDFRLKGRRDPISLHVFANFHPGVRVEQLELVLDAHYGGGGPTPTQILEIRSVVAKGPPPIVSELEWARGGEHLTIRTLEPGRDRARIEVGVAAEHPAGAISAELRGKINGRTFVLPVRGNVYRGIRLSPPQANFNVVKDANDWVEEVELFATDDTPFKILDLSYTARPRALELIPEIKSEETRPGLWTITLTITPKEGQQGGFGGTLNVKTDHSEKPDLQIQVFGHLRGQ